MVIIAVVVGILLVPGARGATVVLVSIVAWGVSVTLVGTQASVVLPGTLAASVLGAAL